MLSMKLPKAFEEEDEPSSRYNIKNDSDLNIAKTMFINPRSYSGASPMPHYMRIETRLPSQQAHLASQEAFPSPPPPVSRRSSSVGTPNSETSTPRPISASPRLQTSITKYFRTYPLAPTDADKTTPSPSAKVKQIADTIYSRPTSAVHFIFSLENDSHDKDDEREEDDNTTDFRTRSPAPQLGMEAHAGTVLQWPGGKAFEMAEFAIGNVITVYPPRDVVRSDADPLLDLLENMAADAAQETPFSLIGSALKKLDQYEPDDAGKMLLLLYPSTGYNLLSDLQQLKPWVPRETADPTAGEASDDESEASAAAEDEGPDGCIVLMLPPHRPPVLSDFDLVTLRPLSSAVDARQQRTRTELLKSRAAASKRKVPDQNKVRS